MKRNLEMVTSVDYRRLAALLDDASDHDDILSILEYKLGRASIIDPIKAPPDLITMNSTIVGAAPEATDTGDDERRTLTLVYPREANIGAGKISIYAPLGAELLGVRAGQVVTWKGIDGIARSLVVEKLVYQPEASGDWHL